MNALLLARIQFAYTVSFHVIFPALSIGLASFLAVMEWKWLKTKDPIFKAIYQFLVKIFAIAFGMGVVSGVVMSYQFGTNWSVFSDKIGNVLGPLLGFEVLTAFFLEASFLGVMLFGWNRVSPRMHFMATCIVALGTLLSAFWILAANSWMQTPQGYTLSADGRFFPTNWLAIIFNPSFPYRFAHMVTAAYLSSALVIGGIGAYFLRQNRYVLHAKKMLIMATGLLAILAPAQLIIGDFHGQNTWHYQPAKVAAIEGIWQDEQGAALRLFAWPEPDEETNRYSLEIPYLSSLILTHHWDGKVKGLTSWPKQDRPPVRLVFWGFRVMVGLGFLMIALGISSQIAQWRNRLGNSKTLLLSWLVMMPGGFIALLAGWIVTETGRQPYVAYGIMRTVHGLSPAVMGAQVAWSLAGFVILYTCIFGAASFYIMRIIKQGITPNTDDEPFYLHSMGASVIAGLSRKENPHV